jgi:hypothetical protein
MLQSCPSGSIDVPITAALMGRDQIIDSRRTAAVLGRICAQKHVEKWFADEEHTIEFALAGNEYESLLRMWAGDLSGAVRAINSSATAS